MKSAVQGRTYAFLLTAVAIASSWIALLLYATGLFHDTELSSVDTRFSIRGHEKPRSDIALVLIDDVTSRELPVRFPFPSRKTHVLIEATANGLRVGGTDIRSQWLIIRPSRVS